MSIKSRGNWKVGICFKKCKNRGKSCSECIRFSNFKTLVSEISESYKKDLK